MSVVKKCFKLLKLRQHFKGVPEREVVAYLRGRNKNLKTDNFGNLYLINPGTPLICAHMDTVQKEDSVDRLHTLRLKDGLIKADNAIIGGDDKCGIAIAMELYEQFGDRISLLFTRQEETGCNGARVFCDTHKDLIAQCDYCLVLDRRGAGDIIGYQNSYCSKEFEGALAKLIKDFGYKPTKGYCSDTGCIAKIINGVNLSVGYYNPHTKQEYVNCDELMNAYLAAYYIIDHFDGKKYPIYSAPVYKGVGLFGDNSFFSENCYMRGYGYDNDPKDIFEGADGDEYFEMTDESTIYVKKDIYLVDTVDDNNFFLIPEGEYDIIEK